MADINVDWGAAPNPNPLSDMSAAVTQGVGQGQQLAAVSALHGIDLNNPDSINAGIGNLVRAGAADQASALMGLQLSRFKNAALMHAINTPLIPPSQPDPSQGAAAPPPSQQAAPDRGAQQQAVLGQAKSTVDSLIATPPGQARATAFANAKAALTAAGMPGNYIDHMVPDPQDTAHLQTLSSTLGNVLDHPQFGGTNPNADLTPHPRSSAFQAPNYASDPGVINSLAQREQLGLPVAETGKLLGESQGYNGVLSPGQETAFGGQASGSQVPFAPVANAPGTQEMNPNTGENIGTPAPYPKTVEQVPPANVPLVFDPTTGTTSVARDGGGGAGSTTGTPDGKVPLKFEPGTVMPSTQAAQMLHNPGAFFGQILGSNGVQVTSAARTPEHNAAVGGVPNSEHIPGNGTAYDFKAPPGMTNQQAIARIVASGTPFDQLIDEGSHIHFGIGPQMRGQVLNMAKSGGTGAPIQGKTLAPPHTIPGGTGLYQNGFAGEVNQVPGTGISPSDSVNSVRGNPAVTGATAAVSNYATMAKNAPTMTGPSALTMLSTMAQSFPDISSKAHDVPAMLTAFGIAPKMIGQFQQAFTGQGPLTPDMKQQLLDAVYGYTQAHYGTAQQVVNGQRQAVQTTGGDPKVLDGVLPALPPHFYVTPPPAQARVRGQVIDTPKGSRMWNGAGWVPVNAGG